MADTTNYDLPIPNHLGIQQAEIQRIAQAMTLIDTLLKEVNDSLATKLAAAGYTAADVLAKLKTVDGTGSEVDADLLDGQHGAYFRDAANMTGTVADANLRQGIRSFGGGGITDCNTLTQSGFYFTNNNPANAPSVGGYGYILVLGLDAAGRCKQIWYSQSSGYGRTFIRDQSVVGTWTDWIETTSNYNALDARYAGANDVTAASILAKLLPVDGTASGLDADKLDGQHGAYFRDAANLTGTMPDAVLPVRLNTPPAAITDWNDATQSGWYRGNAAGNAPPTSIVGTTAWCYGEVVAYDGGNFIIQKVWPASSPVTDEDTKTAMRVCSGGVWSAWFRLRMSQTEMDTRYLDADNMNAGTLPAARLSGTYGISISGGAAFATNATNSTNATNWARSVIAGNGLTGGGAGTANIPVALGTPLAITNSTTNQVTATQHTHALGFVAAEVYQGGGVNDTVFPLGHVLGVVNAASTARNAASALAIRTANSIDYIYNGAGDAGAVLAGIWRARGRVYDNGGIFVRVS